MDLEELLFYCLGCAMLGALSMGDPENIGVNYTFPRI